MKDNKEQIMNTSQVNEEVVALYSTYYYDHVQRIEQTTRRKAFLNILLQVAAKLYSPETGMSLGVQLLENSIASAEEAEKGEYKEG
ncbi:MAG: hypothetical protein H6560_19685 [Lewinellaceae bacterium]|nr:hypothetical protein [Lewinellaceae bacterium]